MEAGDNVPKISEVANNSKAKKAGIKPGDNLLFINDNEIIDVLDYMYYSSDSPLSLKLEDSKKNLYSVLINNDDYEDLGLTFETYLMDSEKSCKNKCVFCFVDQLPKNMRKSLYYKDDDVRLSFLTGNYVTLTNLSDREIDRIIKLKISPINISVHTTNGELRKKLMKNPNAEKIMDILPRFSDAGINMRCQLVICKGLNDGEELKRSLRELYSMYPQVSSVAVVPVGLTCHRTELYPLEALSKDDASETINIVNSFSDKALEENGTRFCYNADEMYIKAGLSLPDYDYYEDFEQLENGVGLIRLLESEFMVELKKAKILKKTVNISVATGISAAPFIQMLIDYAEKKWHNFKCNVYPIQNDFFGRSINVTGLLTGIDIIKQLKDKELNDYLFISSSMLRAGTDIFLDDTTVSDLERELDTKVVVISNGTDFISEIYNLGGQKK